VAGKSQRVFVPPPEEGRRTASLAHEINNPLECLLNLLFLIKSEPNLTENGRRCLELAEEEIQRVSQIAHAALPGFRDAAGPLGANVPNLMGSVIDLYRPRFETQGVAVNTRYCADGDISVRAGPLRQLFTNLLLNAADAMPRGGRLHARVSKTREWSGQRRRGLRVTFADNGCGIPAENLQRIFEPFFTTKGAGGSGLGLSLVKDVVQQHGGWLRVRSSTKHGRSGSTFAIFLPSSGPVDELTLKPVA
jgi:signal transduction histidine kinase